MRKSSVREHASALQVGLDLDLTRLVVVSCRPVKTLSVTPRTHYELEEASTHKSVMTHAGNVLIAAGWLRKTPLTEKPAVYSSNSCGEVTQRKPGVASVACAVEALKRGKPLVTYVRSKRQYCVSSDDQHRLVCFCASWPWPFDPKSKWVFRTYLYVNFCEFDPSCIDFWDIMQTDRQTDKQTPVKTLPSRMSSSWVGPNDVT